tara:strand:+ start:182 stop:595 length:414 start_codon:yes stop_codon:yes gene_type:complete
MPTKEQTKTFIRKHPEIKVKLSGHSVSELNKLVDKAVEPPTQPGIRTEWMVMKSQYDYKKPVKKKVLSAQEAHALWWDKKMAEKERLEKLEKLAQMPKLNNAGKPILSSQQKMMKSYMSKFHTDPSKAINKAKYTGN